MIPIGTNIGFLDYTEKLNGTGGTTSVDAQGVATCTANSANDYAYMEFPVFAQAGDKVVVSCDLFGVDAKLAISYPDSAALVNVVTHDKDEWRRYKIGFTIPNVKIPGGEHTRKCVIQVGLLLADSPKSVKAVRPKIFIERSTIPVSRVQAKGLIEVTTSPLAVKLSETYTSHGITEMQFNVWELDISTIAKVFGKKIVGIPFVQVEHNNNNNKYMAKARMDAATGVCKIGVIDMTTGNLVNMTSNSLFPSGIKLYFRLEI